MRELRTCDFCGTDAVGVFEVLPPELTPADDQRRVVLCDHCEETLNEVMAPLLTRLGVDADVELPEDAPAETGASVPTATDSESVGSAASVDVDSVDAVPTADEPADDDVVADGVDTDETAVLNPLDTDSTRGDADGDEQTETEADEEEPSVEEVGGHDTPSEPPQFRKVIRILQNREFPVERETVEALASNAYDLDDEQVGEIFDYAVERGLLVDDGGTFRRP